MRSLPNVLADERKKLGVLTNWRLNDGDPLGDGDQSLFPSCKNSKRGGPLENPLFTTFQSAWCEGSSVNMFLQTPDRDFPSIASLLSSAPPPLIAFARAAGHGDAPAIRASLSAATPEEITRLCETRHASLRFNALLFCTAGARLAALPGALPPGPHERRDFSAVLLAAGARADAKDVKGCTSLHHATSCSWSRESLEVAQALLRGGADVNARDRSGRVALLEAAMAAGVPHMAAAGGARSHLPPARLLLEAGCDPSAAEVDGCSPMSMVGAMASMLHGEALGFMQAVSSASKRGRKGAGGKTLEGTRATLRGLKSAADLNGQQCLCGPYDPYSGRYSVEVEGRAPVLVKPENIDVPGAPPTSTACSTCGASGVLLSACAACKMALYCSKECQKQAWKEHKKQCVKAGDSVLLKRPANVGGPVSIGLRQDGKTETVQQWVMGTLDSGIVLKLQAPYNRGLRVEQKMLLLYDETRGLCIQVLHDQQPAHAKLLELLGETFKCFVVAERVGEDLNISLKKLPNEPGW